MKQTIHYYVNGLRNTQLISHSDVYNMLCRDLCKMLQTCENVYKGQHYHALQLRLVNLIHFHRHDNKRILPDQTEMCCITSIMLNSSNNKRLVYHMVYCVHLFNKELVSG